MSLPWLFGCSINTPKEPHQKLAADIYAQLAMGYMASGHLDLAEQRLDKALELMPQGKLTLEAVKHWKSLPMQP